jgi:hypothetical protein
MQPVAAATPRRRSAAVKVISDTAEVPKEMRGGVLAAGMQNLQNNPMHRKIVQINQ